MSSVNINISFADCRPITVLLLDSDFSNYCVDYLLEILCFILSHNLYQKIAVTSANFSVILPKAWFTRTTTAS